MTQNRQVRLDGNTSRPPSSDPLPPERVYHCNNLPTCHPHRAPIVPTYFTFRSLHHVSRVKARIHPDFKCAL
ncbi:similar to RIKEN cDNA D030070L09, isoform CRA_a [Rattus norvegicus]|uniref:Similar to RIKEN cDNA D030070L09, isoform CRA_a n=1 Tax=Rattus norvegicus TaxID=10116 RepID=A6J2J8_RAT|nr:similar to RIKEN cDNA D030070L09, isoform CRA_a [Rattus norvegicus]